MIKNIIVRSKNGESVKAKFIELNLSHIDSIIELQNEVVDALENKELYFPSEKEEFENIINNTGKIIGCITESNELIAIGVYCKLGLNKENYGYDIDLSEEELFNVGQIECTIVKPLYRGNKLQYITCEILEKIGKENNTNIIMATASPDNFYSVNTFKKLGYDIVKEKLKYGGLKRYILKKNISF